MRRTDWTFLAIVPAHPEGFLILMLDEREYPLIWATMEAQPGIKVKRIEDSSGVPRIRR